MSATIRFAAEPSKTSKTLICAVTDKKILPSKAKAIDKQTDGLITETLKTRKFFKGKFNEFVILSLPHKTGFERILLVGTGDPKKLTPKKAKNLGGHIAQKLASMKLQQATFFDETKSGNTAHIAAGFELRSYRFDKYKTKSKEAPKTKPLEKFEIISKDYKDLKKQFDALTAINAGVFLARDLVNEAPNVLYPDSYAKIIRDELKPLGVKVEILDEKKMQKLGMDALLAVGMGSSRKPRMVVMHWDGTKTTSSKSKKSLPLALVGKGVTFDTGGISIKPGAGMDEMKMDMGGSAAVVGVIKALAKNKVKVNVMGAVGLAENMPSSTAYRPGDIIGSYAGKNIEVLNTDAEGRLVLVDVLAYMQDKYKPQTIINLATLTGAMMVALGNEYCGVFCNDNDLWKNLETSSDNTGEKLWRMPLDKVWRDEVISDVADLRNMGKSRWGGACTAASFLEHFIEKGTHWAHMDIAGTAWIKADKPTVPKYGTGFGVQVLYDYIEATLLNTKAKK